MDFGHAVPGNLGRLIRAWPRPPGRNVSSFVVSSSYSPSVKSREIFL